MSHKDFTSRLETKNFLKKEDIPKVINYLDPSGKGYVDFIEFSQKIRPNMAHDDETGETREQKAKTSLYFSKPDFEKQTQAVVWNRKTMTDLKKSLGAATYGSSFYIEFI